MEQQGEQDDEAEDQDTRDRCKNRWLQKRKKAGQVPEELLSYLEKCGRQDTTDAVNCLVKRGKGGRFELCLENSWWKETHKKFDSVKGKDKALGYTLTRARVACGGQQGLEQALQTGEVRQVTEGDTTYYVFKARPVFCPFRPLLCFLLLCMQEIQVSHEKGVHSETSCEGGTDVDQKVHSKFKDFVQGYDLNLVPPTLAVGSDPAGGSSCPATLALNEQDKKNLEQSLTLLQTNRQAAEKIYLGITSTTPTAATSRTLLQRNLQNVLGKISELHEVTVFNSHKQHPVSSLLVSNLLREAG